MVRSLCFLAAFALLAAVCWGGEVRTWTDRSGRTATAEFVELDGDDVILKSEGQTYRVPLMDLSQEDRRYAMVESRMQEAPPAPERPEVPPAGPEPIQPGRPPESPSPNLKGTRAQGDPFFEQTHRQIIDRSNGRAGSITCPNCGGSVDPRKAQNDHCTYCGAPLAQTPPAEPAPEPDGGGLTPEDIGKLAGIGMLLFIFVLWKWSQR